VKSTKTNTTFPDTQLGRYCKSGQLVVQEEMRGHPRSGGESKKDYCSRIAKRVALKLNYPVDLNALQGMVMTEIRTFRSSKDSSVNTEAQNDDHLHQFITILETYHDSSSINQVLRQHTEDLVSLRETFLAQEKLLKLKIGAINNYLCENGSAMEELNILYMAFTECALRVHLTASF
jgi:hypothetical protein